MPFMNRSKACFYPGNTLFEDDPRLAVAIQQQVIQCLLALFVDIQLRP
jgi:hypothetical protein